MDPNIGGDHITSLLLGL